MASTVIKDVKLWVDGYDLSGDHNALSLSASKDAVENTPFGVNSRTYSSGLRTVTYSLDGYFDANATDADEPDDVFFVEYTDTANNVLSIGTPPGTAGNIGYSFNNVTTSYTPFGGSVGDMATFSVSGSATGDMVRGTIMEDGTTARSTSSQSTEYNLGDITATEIGYGALHVIATTGSPTLDVLIQSDTTGFPSPTTEITFTQATAVGSQFLSTSGTTTETFWRTSWTFGGTGDITFVVIFGIQNTG